MTEKDRELLREATRLALRRAQEAEVVTPERYEEIFQEERERLRFAERGGPDAAVWGRTLRRLNAVEEDLYRDPVTGFGNRLWLHRYRLDGEHRLMEEGVAALLRIRNYGRLAEEYGESLVFHLSKLFAEGLEDQLKSREIPVETVRYRENEYLLLAAGVLQEEMTVLTGELAAAIESRPFRLGRRTLRLGLERAVVGYARHEPLYLLMDRIEEQLFRQGRGV